MSENEKGTPSFTAEGQGRGRSQQKQVLQAKVESRLRKSGYPDLQRVLCDLCEGVLTLRGRVSSSATSWTRPGPKRPS